MKKLFSYCIPVDDGAAPNPYHGICTLVICKPVIRRNASIGDWIVGTGSTKFGLENKVVYAMEITQKMTMQEYNSYCMDQLPGKIPKWESKNVIERMGDCIYDYSSNPTNVRDGVHKAVNKDKDERGKFALLSDHFYYFGKDAIPLPDHLLAIVKQGQGHKSHSNHAYTDTFIDWILNFSDKKNKVNSDPCLIHKFENNSKPILCSKTRMDWSIKDEEIGDEPLC